MMADSKNEQKMETDMQNDYQVREEIRDALKIKNIIFPLKNIDAYRFHTFGCRSYMIDNMSHYFDFLDFEGV